MFVFIVIFITNVGSTYDDMNTLNAGDDDGDDGDNEDQLTMMDACELPPPLLYHCQSFLCRDHSHFIEIEQSNQSEKVPPPKQ